jgi:hypothetical protein
MGNYVITDRRVALDLPSAIQPVICQTLDQIVDPFLFTRPMTDLGIYIY